MYRPTEEQHVAKKHLHQKEFYDQKIHGDSYNTGDLVWLHSPVPGCESCCKFYDPWTSLFKVVKQLFDATYCIQHLYGNQKHKKVHFAG